MIFVISIVETPKMSTFTSLDHLVPQHTTHPFLIYENLLYGYAFYMHFYYVEIVYIR